MQINLTNDFLTPDNCTVEVIELTPEKIHSRFTYNNGFVMETIQEFDNIVVKTSHKIIMDDEVNGHVDMNQPL